MWYRVFGGNDVQPEPARLLEALQQVDPDVMGKFHGDDLGWFRADLFVEPGAAPLHLERYLAEEEGLRAELNTWAAWLETATDNPDHVGLMEQMITARQVFTLECPAEHLDDDHVASVCLAACRFLARATGGVYQVDSQGLFTPDGILMIKEDP
jgi:hypothetical protein